MAERTLEDILNAAVAAVGFQLWGYELVSENGQQVLRVYIDTDAGVDVNALADISRQVSAVLDVEDPISGAYHLEVSSPGLERRLFKLEHYQRMQQRKARLKLRQPISGQRKWVGIIEGVDGENVLLKSDTQLLPIDFANIEKGYLIFE